MPAAPKFDVASWPKGSRLLNHKGYSIPKSVLTSTQDAWLRAALTVKAEAPPPYDAGLTPFTIFFESAERLYLPRDWAIKQFGEPDKDTRSDGISLREELKFTGKLREEQYPIVNTFIGCDNNGLLCVPCGYGKTFMAIYLAFQLRKRFLVVVHKEFLLTQWQKELEAMCPGIRLGIVQGNKCQIEPEYDAALVMIQTLCVRQYSGDTFKGFGFAIFDECHILGAEHFSKSLLKVQCKHMLGLSATPDRTDGLTKVFTYFLGSIAYRIKHRDADETVRVVVYRFESKDEKFTKVPINYRGEVIRAKLLNQISDFKPRTKYLSERLVEFANEGRSILVLSDRREHLKDFETDLRAGGITNIGYYVGGMKEEERVASEKCSVILGTYAMAATGLNIPALNTVLLATPKSNIEQSVGRILREKKEARKFAPLIMEVLDHQHVGCIGQYNKRKKYYKACGYKLHVLDFGKTVVDDSNSEAGDEDEKTPDEKANAVPQECILLED